MGDVGYAFHSHADHQRELGCVGGGGELLPVGGLGAGAGVAGDEDDAVGVLGQGDADRTARVGLRPCPDLTCQETTS